jgi:hypothetical protein
MLAVAIIIAVIFAVGVLAGLLVIRAMSIRRRGR